MLTARMLPRSCRNSSGTPFWSTAWHGRTRRWRRATYEFRLLNGSDSRFYVLKLDDPNVKVTLVGTDGGLLPKAMTIMDGDGVQEQNEFLVLAPGDRAELVFDFSNITTAHTVHLQNVGPAYSPFQGLNDDGSICGRWTARPRPTIRSATSCSSRWTRASRLSTPL